MANPTACKVLHKKASLAVLHDERNAHLFDAEELQAIALSIPWTRVVEERSTLYAGESVDLLELIASRRDQLVLKPNDEYGGEGKILGGGADEAGWATGLATARHQPHTVLERIERPM